MQLNFDFSDNEKAKGPKTCINVYQLKAKIMKALLEKVQDPFEVSELLLK